MCSLTSSIRKAGLKMQTTHHQYVRWMALLALLSVVWASAACIVHTSQGDYDCMATPVNGMMTVMCSQITTAVMP
jgi:hypothetical protein